MGQNKKFRNHISIVVEQLGSGIISLVVVLIGILLPNLDDIAEMDLSMIEGKWLFLAAGILAVVVFSIGRSFLLWAKTWISIQDQAVVIEKNMLNQKVNTIGIRNISNVNTEQNLFEMVMGTCKVKLDTNSLSTANETDVKIVLKKRDAENFRREVARLMKEAGGRADIEYAGAQAGHTEGAASFARPGYVDEYELEDYDIAADIQDIAFHGLFSISIFSVALAIAGIAGTVYSLMEMAGNPDFLKNIVSAAAGIIVGLSIAASAVWDTVKDFLRYYNFRVKRRNDRLYIRYGLLKKVEYTVPVDKIQALKIRQTFVARMAGRYMVEMINVGMGDDAGEKNSFLLLYDTRAEMQRKLGLLLPEFADIAVKDVKRQPGKAWLAWTLPFGIYTVCMAAACVWGGRYFPQYARWICIGAAVCVLFGLAIQAFYFMASGIVMEDKFVKSAVGYLGRSAVVVSCDKIQYVEISQNFIARACGIQKGVMHLLAPTLDNTKVLPYFREGLEERIKVKMLDG